MANGTVKWFSPKKGYGFITMEDGQEVFVHYSAIDGAGFRSLEQGERVEFEVAQGPKGLQASNVNKGSGGAPGDFRGKGGTVRPSMTGRTTRASRRGAVRPRRSS